MNLMETFLLTLSVTGCTTAAVAWLAKALVSQWLSKDIETHKLRLTLAAQEHQICFSSLHQKQAEIIAECYQRFLEAQACIHQISTSNAKEFTADERRIAEVAIDRCLAGMIVFHKNQLYFSDDLYKRMTNISLRVFNYASLFNGMSDMLDNLAKEHGQPERMRVVQEILRDGWKNVKNDVPELLSELKRDFRGLLGIHR